ncbi:MAG: ABC transporter ATP-binding protein/permease [Lachnospiraceae bacterium]|nr:ABC transporter ATP-binding protein/permease [Lachnospiraceae bacterium]
MKGVRELIKHLKPYRLQILGAIISGILKEFFIVAAVGICAYMAARVAKGQPLEDHPYMLLLVLVVIARAVFAYLESFLNHDVSYHILVDFRVGLYEKFITICPDILLTQRSGQISTTLMNDVEVLEWFYAHTVGIVFVDAAVVAALTVFLGSLHWLLAVCILISTLLLIVIPFIMRKKADVQGAESRFRLGEANSVTLEGINGLNELLMLNAVDSYKKKNRAFMDRLIDIQIRYAKRMGTEGGLLQVTSGITAVLINIIAISLVFQNRLSLEWYAVIGTSVWLVFAPILELCGMIRNFGVIFAASDRISNILTADPLVEDTGKVTDISEIVPEVTFDHVDYTYVNTSDKVLHDVSFKAERGKVTAIVGESGAGKTTCINLMTRMWDVQNGTIRIGDVDIRDIKLDALHHLITTVPQDVYLFNISLRDNISLGRKDATDEEIIRAAKMARVHDFIISLPDGYDTIAGERGLQMSGGQRQRIAIARALLMDAPVIIMDEAVSNLDTKTDLEIQKTIRSLADQKTIILVAHRLSTIVHADQLIVMKQGKVVQTGTHQQLVGQEGFYRRLVEAQMKEA